MSKFIELTWVLETKEETLTLINVSSIEHIATSENVTRIYFTVASNEILRFISVKEDYKTVKRLINH